MRKIAALLAVVLLMVTTLASCEKKPDPESEKGSLATNDIVDYFFYYPEGWEINISTGMISLTYAKDLLAQTNVTNPEGDGAMGVYLKPQYSVTAFNLNSNEYPSVQSYWDMCWAQYGSVYQNLTLESQEEVKVGDYDAFKFVFTGELAGVTYQYSQTVFFAKAMVYSMTYTSLPDSFDELLNDVQSMKDTFEHK